MAKRPPGARYPHVTTDAREADHSYCPVLAAVLSRIETGKESWGSLHVAPQRFASREAALEARRGLFRARNHTGRKRGSCGARALSLQSGAEMQADGSWVVWYRVFDRAAAKKEIARRVGAGEPLAYNVMRRRP
jgi:hypothetical protein